MGKEIDLIVLLRNILKLAKKRWYVFIFLLILSVGTSTFLYKNQKIKYKSEAVVYLGNGKVQLGVYYQFFELLDNHISNENYGAISNILRVPQDEVKKMEEIKAFFIEEEKKSLRVSLVVNDTESLPIFEEAILNFCNENEVEKSLNDPFINRISGINNIIVKEKNRLDSIWKNKTFTEGTDASSVIQTLYDLQNIESFNEYHKQTAISASYLTGFQSEGLNKVEFNNRKVYTMVSIFASFIMFLMFLLMSELWKIIK